MIAGAVQRLSILETGLVTHNTTLNYTKLNTTFLTKIQGLFLPCHQRSLNFSGFFLYFLPIEIGDLLVVNDAKMHRSLTE